MKRKPGNTPLIKSKRSEEFTKKKGFLWGFLQVWL